MQQNYEFLVKSGNSKPCLVKFGQKDSKMLDDYLEEHPDVNPSDLVKMVTVAYTFYEDKPEEFQEACEFMARYGFNYGMLVKYAVRKYAIAKQRAERGGCILRGFPEGKKVEVSKEEVEKMKKLLGIAE